MTDTHITEIIPDLNDLPDWAREAFEEGQYFNAVDKKIKQVEAIREKVSELVTVYFEGCSADEFDDRMREIQKTIREQGK